MSETVKHRFRTIAISAALALVAGAGIGAGLAFYQRPAEHPAQPKAAAPAPEKPRRFWCSTPAHDKLSVYIERDSPAPAGLPLGDSFVLDAKAVFDNLPPLAVRCQGSTLWWLNKDSIFHAKLAPSANNVAIEVIRKISHTDVPEYIPAGSQVIAGDIQLQPDGSMPVVATLSNTGWFFAIRVPSDGSVIRERFNINLRTDPKIEAEQVLSESMTSAVVGIVNTHEFLVIPIGGPDAEIFRAYDILWRGGGYDDSNRTSIPGPNFRKVIRDFQTITGIRTLVDGDPPIVFNAARGGWVSIVQGITFGGAPAEIDGVLTTAKESREIINENKKGK